tara:strand:+ start:3868 stop:4452 length:585 start_codon:yes stop_codon:yes gene_type:complete
VNLIKLFNYNFTILIFFYYFNKLIIMNKSERNLIISIIISIVIIFLIIIKILLDYINNSQKQNQNMTLNKPISVNINKNKEDNEPPLKSIPINIPTRGETKYVQIGILSNSDNDKVLPLYGKQTYQRSQQWNYYTTSDSYNLIKIPLSYQGKDCMDETGCREINDGDSILIEEYGETFKVKIYESSKFRYIPYV